MEKQLRIRQARPEDAAGLLEIYRPYVEHTTVSFEYEVPSVAEFQNRIENTLKNYPYVVAENEAKELLGYAYASIFHGRVAYSWSVETSIYVKAGVHSQGVGSRLYAELERLLAAQHVCNLYACIAHPNPESEAFHARLGYRKNAHFQKAGYKQGQWVDIIWMEKTLQAHPDKPQTFVPFEQLKLC